MTFTEELLADMVKDVTGSYELKLSKGSEVKVVNFKGPYKRIPLVKGIEEAVGHILPSEFDSEESRATLDSLCVNHHIHCGEPRTASRYHIPEVGYWTNWLGTSYKGQLPLCS